MGTTTAVELVLDARADLAEGPVWDDRSSTLLWVDIMAHAVHRFDPVGGEDEIVDVGQPVGAVSLRQNGGLLLALRDGFALLDDDGGVELITDTELGIPTNRMNDGKSDTSGRFWAGSMSFTFEPKAGTFYRLDPDFAVTAVLREMTLSNGLGWSPDDQQMYLIDSLEHRLDVLDFDRQHGTVSNRRTLVAFSGDNGLPDGMCVDAEGFLWVAMYGAEALHRYRPDGTLAELVELPVSQPTCCAFGGEDLADLYITTAAQEKTPEELEKEPTLGGIFRCRPGVRGLPTNRFAG